MTSQETVKNAVYVGDKPVRAYEDYAISVLRREGTAVLMARGQTISRTIYIAHRITRDFPAARIVDERSHLERMPFKGPEDTEERMRDVPVFAVTLVVDADMEPSEGLEDGLAEFVEPGAN